MWDLVNKKEFLVLTNTVTGDGRVVYVNKLTSSFIFDDTGVKINPSGGNDLYVKFSDIDNLNGVAVTSPYTNLKTMLKERITSTGKAINVEKLSVGSGVVVSLALVPTGANYALITVEGDSMRYYLDGTDPSSTDGLKRVDGDTIDLGSEEDISGFKVISTGTTILQIQYFG